VLFLIFKQPKVKSAFNIWPAKSTV